MPNRLHQETSPYLLQHADNPVHWQPWDEQALAMAREQNKPILLSIGYSACHWCHVMAHESFEHPPTAEVMNRYFVNIKVDREERPELDKIYQTAHYLITQQPGGWPLTMFLTPEGVPFFGGTYFPREAGYGRPGFADLCLRVAEVYSQQGDEIGQQGESLRRALRELSTPPRGSSTLSFDALDTARLQLAEQHDHQHGGFGDAPKFPQPQALERLLRHWSRSVPRGHEDHEALQISTFSLERMAVSGLYDQLGGGFFRYAVDAQWRIPHFEKMLYDNAQLLPLYAEAAAATDNDLFRRICRETATWVMDEMQGEHGGYHATQDADLDGEEGGYYVWEQEEVEGVLGEDFELFAAGFGLDQPANFEGRWHLRIHRHPQALAEGFGIDPDVARRRLDTARDKLLLARRRRAELGMDDKVITAWNALMIRGMAIAGRLQGREDWLDSAERALGFIRRQLWHDGRLRATWRSARARHSGCLDDYAFLIDALLELLQARWNNEHLDWARQLAEVMLAHFRHEQGGFYFTADDHEQLISRPFATGDEATPSGNGVAAQVLQRLGWLLGEKRYLQAAEETLRATEALMHQAPMGHCSLLHALEEHLEPPLMLILRGEEPALQPWTTLLNTAYGPDRLAFAIPAHDPVPDALAEKTPLGEACAYPCRGMQCQPPITDLGALKEKMAR